ncbi:hypothetical protein A2U01_0059077, partial [Trifolium medium]|nr:hypothetical protein [Trifolium medium]
MFLLMTPSPCLSFLIRRLELKIVLKVYNDMKADVVSLKQLPQRFKSPEQTQVEKAFARPSVGEDSQTSGTYVIGGS